MGSGYTPASRTTTTAFTAEAPSYASTPAESLERAYSAPAGGKIAYSTTGAGYDPTSRKAAYAAAALLRTGRKTEVNFEP